MIRMTFPLACACMLLTTTPSWAQSGPRAESGYPFPATVSRSDSPSAQMYEDIEIMRRLLVRQLGSPRGVASAGFYLHRLSLDLTGLPAGAADSDAFAKHCQVHGIGLATSHADGAYLKGHGVVYTASLYGHTGPVVSDAPSKPKAFSDWERTRKELRGEKAEPEAKAQESNQTSLADSVLKLLYENGRHFTALTDKNERITVVVTLHDLNENWLLGQNEMCMKCHSPSNATSSAEVLGRYFAGGFQSTRGVAYRDLAGAQGTPLTGDAAAGTMQPLPGGGQESKNPKGPGVPVLEEVPFVGNMFRIQGNFEYERATQAGQAQKSVLTGDLHMKQNQPLDAAKDYGQAADGYRKLLSLQAEFGRGAQPSKDVATYLALAEVYIKIARARQAAGQTDKVREVMKQADSIIADLWVEKEKPATAAQSKPAVRLPAKLIVSAPKAIFDQAGLNFADFKKGASVQYLTFSTKDAGGEKKP